MLKDVLAENKIMPLDDQAAIAQMKRGSRRGTNRKTPVVCSWIARENIMKSLDEIEIALAKRGSCRGVTRMTPLDASHWAADPIIAFPPFVRSLPVAANN